MPLGIGDTAPTFSGHDIVNDEPFNLSDHAGSVILLAFSGITWCPPCQYEAPYLQQLWQEFTDGITNPPVKFLLVSTKFGGTESLGALQTICLDKTGTHTQNRMEVVDLALGATEMPLEIGTPHI